MNHLLDRAPFPGLRLRTRVMFLSLQRPQFGDWLILPHLEELLDRGLNSFRMLLHLVVVFLGYTLTLCQFVGPELQIDLRCAMKSWSEHDWVRIVRG